MFGSAIVHFKIKLEHIGGNLMWWTSQTKNVWC